MSHSCLQNLYIVANSENDAEALLKQMAGNIKTATGTDVLAGARSPLNWKDLAKKIANATMVHGVAVFSDEPGTMLLAGSFRSWEAFGKPCFCIKLNLKRGPSHLPGQLCSTLDETSFGWASINGGEYMLACDDGTAFLESSGHITIPSKGALDREEYLQLEEQIMSLEEPDTVHEVALCQLFAQEVADFYFRNPEEEADCSDANQSAEPRRTHDPALLKEGSKRIKANAFGTAKNDCSFAVGDKVEHAVFGRGIVISVDGDMLHVKFAKAGRKKLLKGYAPLTKVI